jgi:chemotaxis protein methyltransferase CheR
VDISASSRRILAGLLESRTGQQLTSGRRWRVDAALAPMVREGGFGTVDQLVARLASGAAPALAEQVIEALLNNETYFYRDRLPFDLLMAGPLQRFEATRSAERKLSIWSVGCSTGQELYSIAMSLAEQDLRWRGWRIELVGTDISRAAIERARAGRYSQFEVQRGLPVTQMVRWFTDEGNGQWQIASKLRDAVRFEVRSITERPPRPGSSTSSCAATCSSIFPKACAAWHSPAGGLDRAGRSADAGRRRNRDRPDRPVRLRPCRGLYIPAAAAAPVAPGRLKSG